MVWITIVVCIHPVVTMTIFLCIHYLLRYYSLDQSGGPVDDKAIVYPALVLIECSLHPVESMNVLYRLVAMNMCKYFAGPVCGSAGWIDRLPLRVGKESSRGQQVLLSSKLGGGLVE